MSPTPKFPTPNYGGRSVKEWLTMASNGEIVLPTFQRSFVWKPALVAEYIKALYNQTPTGVFLVLEATDPPQFKSRSLQDAGKVASNPRFLLLDGQQRLTALWKALTGSGSRRYFLKVEDLIESRLDIKEVEIRSLRYGTKPSRLVSDNLVPLDILWQSPNTLADANKISIWCDSAADREQDNKSWVKLFETVTELKNSIMGRQLRFCELDVATPSRTAIDIFINMNRSSVKLTEVDISVALAESEHDDDLRARAEKYLNESQEIGHYFKKQDITGVVEWMLKVGCLKSKSNGQPGLPPKKTLYSDAIKVLCSRDGDKEERWMQFTKDLDSTLRFVAERGGATEKTLPGWPPVHVLAALQEPLRQLTDDTNKARAEKLLNAYVWRAFLTDRYQAQANDRLLRDYRGLKRCLALLEKDNETNLGDLVARSNIPVFESHYFKAEDLLEDSGKTGKNSRLGRAVTALALADAPPDWISGGSLTVDKIRQLEDDKKLVRYEIFPAQIFDKPVPSEVKNGLNCILMEKDKMPNAAERSPLKFCKWIRDERCGEGDRTERDLEMRSRVVRHLVPYSAFQIQGVPPYQLRKFLKARATEVFARAENHMKL